MFKERWYQKRATKKAIESINKGMHPCVVLPTGSGKTIVICGITGRFLDKNIEKNVLILSHRKKILQQDYEALSRHFPETEIGLYSAGLFSKTVCKITVAGIQSVWRNKDLFKSVGLIIIDEAHLINHSEGGMYRNFLEGINAQYVGLTATPFRLGHGYIYKGDERIFNDIAYDLSSTENYNKLISHGYLSPMYSRKTKFLVDTSDIKRKGMDFDQASARDKFDRDGITDVACNEIMRTAIEGKLKKGLIFAIDIDHAVHIHNKMLSLGIRSFCIHSKMDEEEEEVLSEYAKNEGAFKCAVNVDILTTGLDIPDIDLIGILRPTNSPSLHVQMLGRGGRPVYSEGFDLLKKKGRRAAIKNGVKPFCIVLDFAGNVNRLGPINNVAIEENYFAKKGTGKGKPVTKVCPECETIVHAAIRKCDCCGHEFKFVQKITSSSSSKDVVSEESLEEKKGLVWHNVDHVVYSVKMKTGKPSSMMVTYSCGKYRFREYVCIDHSGFARRVALQWIRPRLRHGERKPRDLSELFKIKGKLRVPRKVLVSHKNGYFNVTNWEF